MLQTWDCREMDMTELLNRMSHAKRLVTGIKLERGAALPVVAAAPGIGPKRDKER